MYKKICFYQKNNVSETLERFHALFLLSVINSVQIGTTSFGFDCLVAWPVVLFYSSRRADCRIYSHAAFEEKFSAAGECVFMNERLLESVSIASDEM